jgi:hypothetical protein
VTGNECKEGKVRHKESNFEAQSCRQMNHNNSPLELSCQRIVNDQFQISYMCMNLEVYQMGSL